MIEFAIILIFKKVCSVYVYTAFTQSFHDLLLNGRRFLQSGLKMYETPESRSVEAVIAGDC